MLHSLPSPSFGVLRSSTAPTIPMPYVVVQVPKFAVYHPAAEKKSLKTPEKLKKQSKRGPSSALRSHRTFSTKLNSKYQSPTSYELSALCSASNLRIRFPILPINVTYHPSTIKSRLPTRRRSPITECLLPYDSTNNRY
jgi:hypothetical protein